MMIQPAMTTAAALAKHPAPQSTTANQTTGTDSPQTSSTDDSPDDINEDQFLQLLVAQIQYQDPTNPTDSTAFVTQLAQFSQLEQIIAIRGDIESYMGQNSGATQSTTSTSGGNS
jgi:flagellar basal-body rod modification protein FlgD